MKYMKQLFTALLLCTSIAVFAQPAQSIRILNRSNCTVYVSIQTGPNPCAWMYLSSVIAVPPGPPLFYSSSTLVPGLTTFPPSLITSARIYSSTTTCGIPTTWFVGNPCTGYPLTQGFFVLNSSCSVCSQTITANWLVAGVPGGTATLDFF